MRAYDSAAACEAANEERYRAAGARLEQGEPDPSRTLRRDLFSRCVPEEQADDALP